METFIHYQPKLNELGIRPDGVMEMLHEADRTPDNPVMSEAVQTLGILPETVDIRGGYVLTDDIALSPGEGTLRVKGTTLHPSGKICSLLREAEQVALFVCTAGQGITDYARRCNEEGDYLKGYIADTYGSLIVEKAMDYIQLQLEQQMEAEGLHINNRYSPGYCNWDVREQKLLFSLLPDNNCHITLTESCLMLPIKSVSGIIGIGRNVKKRAYGCHICHNTTCIYRRIRDQQTSQ